MAVVLPFAWLAAKDLIGAGRRPVSFSAEERNAALDGAVKWLKRCQNASGDGGFSQGFYLYRHGRWGWLPSYRETTGYIVETLYDYASARRDGDGAERALTAAKWLLSIEKEDGSVGNPNFGRGGLVFDTGQVLFGFMRAYGETGRKDCPKAAVRAGDWLCAQADDSGLWTKSTHNNLYHAYNTRVAWALLELWKIFGSQYKLYERIARANLDYAVENQRDGWYTHNSFTDDGIPFTHNIAYALRGCWEAGALLEDDRYKASAEEGIKALIPHIRENGFIPGKIDERGRAASRSCCLTGNCQLSIVLYKLYREKGDDAYRDLGDRSLAYVMSCQNLLTPDPRIRGAVKGSHPLTGSYTILGYPNWAAKFLADALLLRRRLDDGED